jgi:8-oxo-dGTP diphosphatase
MTGERKVTEVAVGVVFSPDGERVLFGQRPAGKPYAGWWELPGGKVEVGETVQQALVRELQEELRITATQLSAWAIVEHDYPHAFVRLHFYRVFAFLGQPTSLEQQAFAWASRDASDLSPLLPATAPVLQWLTLPVRLDCRTRIQSEPKVSASFAVQGLDAWQAPVLSSDELRALTSRLSDAVLGAFIETEADLALAAKWDLNFTLFRMPPVATRSQADWMAFSAVLRPARQPMYAHLEIEQAGDAQAAQNAGAQGLSLAQRN